MTFKINLNTGKKPKQVTYEIVFAVLNTVHGRLNHLFLCRLSCVGVDEDDAPDIDIYHCPNCEKTHGKSTRESGAAEGRGGFLAGGFFVSPAKRRSRKF